MVRSTNHLVVLLPFRRGTDGRNDRQFTPFAKVDLQNTQDDGFKTSFAEYVHFAGLRRQVEDNDRSYVDYNSSSFPSILRFDGVGFSKHADPESIPRVKASLNLHRSYTWSKSPLSG